MKKNELIIIDSQAYYALLSETIEYVERKITPPEPVWISPEAAMELLNCGVSTLMKLRHEGRIVYSQISSKIILYKYESSMEFLESHVVY